MALRHLETREALSPANRLPFQPARCSSTVRPADRAGRSSSSAVTTCGELAAVKAERAGATSDARIELMANIPVVVDGRVDLDKLRELLRTGAEQEALDFKATINFDDPGDQVELVKDLVAMMSLPEGGYIIIGVDNDGRYAAGHAPIKKSLFDSAILLQKLTAYVDGRVNIVSQVHDVELPDGSPWQIALIFAGPPPNLLPLVIKKQGEYERTGGKNKVIAFRIGQVLVREGTTTSKLRAEFWPRLLERYVESVREDTRKNIDALVSRIVGSIRDQEADVRSSPSDGRRPTAVPTPIDVEMDVQTFAIAADALIETGSLPRLDRFLMQAGAQLRQSAASGHYMPGRGILDRIFILATSAVLYGNHDQLDRIMRVLFDYYRAIPQIADATSNTAPHEKQSATIWFDVLSRLYLLGALAFRQNKWSALRSIVLRRFKVHENFSYASWLRHAITSAARAEVLNDNRSDNRGAPVISRAIQIANEVPELRPDLPGPDNLYARLVNSLCEFDVIWCVLAQSVTDRPDATDFYPSSSELDQEHANGAFVLLADDDEARRTLFPDKSDQEVGSAMLYVYSRAFRQAMNHPGWWDRLPSAAALWAEHVHADKPAPLY